MFEESSNPVLYAVWVADSEREVPREAHAKFERLPAWVTSRAWPCGCLAPGNNAQLLAQIRSQFSYVPAQLPAIPGADPWHRQSDRRFLPKVQNTPEEEHAKHVADATDEFLNRFEKLSQAEQIRMLNQFQYRMAVDLLNRFQSLRYAANDEEIQASDLPNELVSRFVSAPDAEGSEVVVADLSQGTDWDEAPLTHFVSELQTVDPNAHGNADRES